MYHEKLLSLTCSWTRTLLYWADESDRAFVQADSRSQITQPWKGIHGPQFKVHWLNLCSSQADKHSSCLSFLKHIKRKKEKKKEPLRPAIPVDKDWVGGWYPILWTILLCTLRNLSSSLGTSSLKPITTGCEVLDVNYFKESHNYRTGRLIQVRNIQEKQTSNSNLLFCTFLRIYYILCFLVNKCNSRDVFKESITRILNIVNVFHQTSNSS